MQTYLMPKPNQWAELFDVACNLRLLDPWQYIGAGDCILIQLEEPRSDVFCSVIGQAGPYQGVSIFVGERGCRDYFRVISLGESAESPAYVMRDITCLNLYWGDREEVPADQKAAIRQSGLKFRGRGNWPYFLSNKSRYEPASLDAGEAKLFTEVLKNLFMVARAFAEGRIDPDGFDENLLIRRYDPETSLWNTGWLPMPDLSAELPRVRLQDELLRARLKAAPRNQAKIIMDLLYLNEGYSMQKGIRFDAELICCMLDEGKHTIEYLDIVPPDMDEINGVYNGFISYVEKKGRMRQIRARNPWVLSALDEICSVCKIKLIQDTLPEMDEISEELPEYFIE